MQCRTILYSWSYRAIRKYLSGNVEEPGSVNNVATGFLWNKSMFDATVCVSSSGPFQADAVL